MKYQLYLDMFTRTAERIEKALICFRIRTRVFDVLPVLSFHYVKRNISIKIGSVIKFSLEYFLIEVYSKILLQNLTLPQRLSKYGYEIIENIEKNK